jgi:hypothetical protein
VLAAGHAVPVAEAGRDQAQRVEHVDLRHARSTALRPGHVQRRHARLIGGVGLDGADDGPAADLVEGLGAVAGGVDAGHAGLQVLVGQHAHQAAHAAVLQEADVGRRRWR